MRVLPAAELQQLYSFLWQICILNQLLDVAVTQQSNNSTTELSPIYTHNLTEAVLIHSTGIQDVLVSCILV